MRADNPFAQKQMTKISRLGEGKPVALKNSEEIRWSEKFTGRKRDTAEDGQGAMKNMIEIKEMKPLEETRDNGGGGQLQPATKEQTLRLQYLFQKLIKEAVTANNEEMADHLVERITENVKGDLCKELDYQFRLMEERDEERVSQRNEQEDRRNEDYYKRIDELLRQYSAKGGRQKTSRPLFKKQEKQESDNTVKFVQAKEEALEQQKPDKKQKKEFHFLKRAAEVK